MNGTDTEGTGLSLETRCKRMLVVLFKKEAMGSLTECKRECILVERIYVHEKSSSTTLVESGLVSRGLCSTLSDYDKLRNKTSILETGDYVLHEQRAYATHKFGAEERL